MINQIRCLGVLATIKARQNAYPIRYGFKEFYEKFWECCGGPSFRAVKNDPEDSSEWKPRSMKIIDIFRNEFEEF
jgi:myosin heavy subunit